MKIGDKCKLTKSVYSNTGLVPAGTVVKVEDTTKDKKSIRVKDHVGRIFWVQPDILISLDDIYSKGE